MRRRSHQRVRAGSLHPESGGISRPVRDPVGVFPHDGTRLFQLARANTGCGDELGFDRLSRTPGSSSKCLAVNDADPEAAGETVPRADASGSETWSERPGASGSGS
jgi:hypothetical protein